ncbi:FadR/GntR family transcriptional regulator [Paenibacillus cisolokensis]|jgi:GntR family transcriptional repressor for pyruvate dehydrogenase complex|uniref:HTH-type transcriptional regulator LutR n=1 Tax=Paenibacillus cisolokensis TaxID=1658519 RepID=A0ABQ4NED8_9BACL|nr:MULTISPECIES: FadR/GntR family transcriptional regulator [Paenibacillus]ALS28532.1 GntR family transcriptional regulator [Paenibacillus sp. 32O-W]GIQ66584.1 HTH-type transcriptional regulator LutR [Paenibacillus cisolokensis]
MKATDNRPLKSYEWVLQDIERQIREGRFAAGERLPSVVELSAHYKVGRSTIREALSALKAMGLLDIRQGGGTFAKQPEEAAAPPHPADIDRESWIDRSESVRHILEVRRVLETGAAALAAANRTEDDLAALEETLAGMAEHRDDERYNEQADVRFHLQIAAATRNPVIADLMQSLSRRLHDSMRDTRALWFYSERSTADRLLREHQAIYEAIAARDADEAANRMQLHIAKVEQVLNDKGAAGK